MGGPLPVTLSDIHLIRTESNVVKPEKPFFYRRFVDDIINRRKKNEHNTNFENLNKYDPKRHLTIDVNPCKFLGTKSLTIKVTSQQKFFVKCPNYPCIVIQPWFQIGTNEIL